MLLSIKQRLMWVLWTSVCFAYVMCGTSCLGRRLGSIRWKKKLCKWPRGLWVICGILLDWRRLGFLIFFLPGILLALELIGCLAVSGSSWMIGIVSYHRSSPIWVRVFCAKKKNKKQKIMCVFRHVWYYILISPKERYLVRRSYLISY